MWMMLLHLCANLNADDEMLYWVEHKKFYNLLVWAPSESDMAQTYEEHSSSVQC